MRVSDLFHVYSGSKLDFGKCIRDENGVNFISRNSNNNGVVGRVQYDVSMKLYKKGDITVPLGGSYLLSAFVQDEDFVTAQNVAVLRAKKKMTEIEKWFYCYSLRINRFKYSAFGREVNKYIKDIELPVSIPKWVYTKKIVLPKTNNSPINKDLEIQKWAYFKVKDELFKIEQCKCSNASGLLEDGNEIDYIGAKKDDGGIMYKVMHNPDLETRGNCIIFICDGQGSVGYTNYRQFDFIGSTTLSVGRNNNLNKYTGLFLVTILDRERYRFSFGRKYRTNLGKLKIKLPCKCDEKGKIVPDWKYMEDYIKHLPYGDII